MDATEKPAEPKVRLTRCPACKNLIGTDTVCCPRCGIDFRARRRRRVLFILVILGVGGYYAHGHAVAKGWTRGLPHEWRALQERWNGAP